MARADQVTASGGQSAHRLHRVADRLEQLLPQTQCRKCGYKGCRPYAEALAGGRATPDLCEPGGAKITADLAKALSLDINELPKKPDKPDAQVARIDESACVGCYKCIEACPVDAVVGAHGFMHTVLATECTGCGLCVEPCPMDCIDMVDASGLEGTGQLVHGGVSDRPEAYQAAQVLKRRYEAKRERPPLRGPEGPKSREPEEMARLAMSRARRRQGKL